MTIPQALWLALVQGVTEFLPISSSAHLVLASAWMGWPDQGLGFDIAVNTGTVLAVVVYFRRDLGQLLRGLAAGLRRGAPEDGNGPPTTVEGLPPRRLAAALVLGTLPVAIAGLLLQDWVATAGRSVTLIAVTSIAFGLLLGVADRWGRRRRELASLTLGDALLIGAAQALALVPGTSRAGITVTAALLLGLRRPAAARFSFLLYLPVGVLVAAKDVLDLATGTTATAELPVLLLGLGVAAVSGYVVIGALLAWLNRQSLLPFVVYRVALGLAILLVG